MTIAALGFANHPYSLEKAECAPSFSALAAIVPAFAIDRARAADELPEFNIARNCDAEISDASIVGPKACMSDETEAKDRLANRWSSYSASQKKQCGAAPEARGVTSNF